MNERESLFDHGVQPPPEISILVCPLCGRDDQFAPFIGKSHHKANGKCAGTPARVTYQVKR